MKCKDCANANSCTSVAEQNGNPLDLEADTNCRCYASEFRGKRTRGVRKIRTTGVHEMVATVEDYL